MFVFHGLSLKDSSSVHFLFQVHLGNGVFVLNEPMLHRNICYQAVVSGHPYRHSYCLTTLVTCPCIFVIKSWFCQRRRYPYTLCGLRCAQIHCDELFFSSMENVLVKSLLCCIMVPFWLPVCFFFFKFAL